MSTELKALLKQHGISQTDLARGAAVSRPMVVALCKYPARSPGELAAQADIESFLSKRGISLEEKAATRSTASRPVKQSHPPSETNTMLRKQQLSMKARTHFGLLSDPFGECLEPADVFRSPSINAVREAIATKVRLGGLLAVIGESGAGKSTVREEGIERFGKDGQVIFIQPYVLTMATTDTAGRVLKASSIIESIMATVAPVTALRRSPNARSEQVHNVLRESSRAGHRHVLVIEEAHDLAVPTLKHLKRFVELKDGMKSLLSVILVGQQELARRLGENNVEVRELVQRLEVAYLPPLDADLEPYLKHRFLRAKSTLERIVEPAAVEAIRARLSPTTQRGSTSLLYPLAVNNLLAAAMNATAELGAPKVSAEAVREAVR